jgi:hypothetical protein
MEDEKKFEELMRLPNKMIIEQSGDPLKNGDVVINIWERKGGGFLKIEDRVNGRWRQFSGDGVPIDRLSTAPSVWTFICHGIRKGW